MTTKPIDIDGRLQLTAGLALLEISRLVEWDDKNHEFHPISRNTFEYSWRKGVDPVFGRLACWIHFSAGAEFYLKGTCLLCGIDFRDKGKAAMYPTGDLDQWAQCYLKNWKSVDTVQTMNYGTLGKLTSEKNGTPIICELCQKANATESEKVLLIASYRFLQFSIRNRDAHAYVPNVRGAHYHLVPKLFSRSLNVLSSWIPGGKSTVTMWKENAKAFVESN